MSQVIFISALFIFGYILIRYLLRDPKKPAPRGFSWMYVTAAEIRRCHHLLEYLEYYHLLSNEGKKRFLKRTIRFKHSKKWVGGYGMDITDDMKFRISASAVQLTFGLKNFLLGRFYEFRIYPKDFRAGPDKLHMKGGTVALGIVLLSWKDFKQGYADPDDRINLGLHELAHALELDALRTPEFDRTFAHFLNDWHKTGAVEFKKMRQGHPSFLREYAATDMREFFAVSVEHFFEVPEGFKQHLPDLYKQLCFLLNQDPLNKTRDYKLDPALRIERHDSVH